MDLLTTVTHTTVWQLTALLSVPSCASPQPDCTLLFIYKNNDHVFEPLLPLPDTPPQRVICFKYGQRGVWLRKGRTKGKQLYSRSRIWWNTGWLLCKWPGSGVKRRSRIRWRTCSLRIRCSYLPWTKTCQTTWATGPSVHVSDVAIERTYQGQWWSIFSTHLDR